MRPCNFPSSTGMGLETILNPFIKVCVRPKGGWQGPGDEKKRYLLRKQVKKIPFTLNRSDQFVSHSCCREQQTRYCETNSNRLHQWEYTHQAGRSTETETDTNDAVFLDIEAPFHKGYHLETQNVLIDHGAFGLSDGQNSGKPTSIGTNKYQFYSLKHNQWLPKWLGITIINVKHRSR